MYNYLLESIAVIILLLEFVQLTRNKPYGKWVVRLALLLYFCSLIYFTFIKGPREGLSRISIRWPLPFYRAIKKHHYGLVTNRSVLNMLLFIPFGYLLPQVKTTESVKSRWNIFLIIAAGFLTSLIIESCQLLFHFGAFELDDLVKNTLGTIIGCLLYLLFNGARHRL